MSLLEWIGLFSVVVGVFIGLIFVFKNVDGHKKAIENIFYEKE